MIFITIALLCITMGILVWGVRMANRAADDAFQAQQERWDAERLRKELDDELAFVRAIKSEYEQLFQEERKRPQWTNN